MVTKKSKTMESVSIIGVGCTPFGSILTTPEIKDMTERELFAWAALEAMEDAGIEAKDVDAFYIGQCMPETLSHSFSSAAYVADWIGMRDKPGFHHESACASPPTGLILAVLAVASGKYKIVLSGGVETLTCTPKDGKPPHMRAPLPEEELMSKTHYGGDQAYYYQVGASGVSMCDMRALGYGKRYGLTLSQLEDALDAVAINNRRNGVRNPLATTYKKEFAEEAKERGFNDVKAYMRSRFNPKMGIVTRPFYATSPMDGASALIVCPTSMARKFTETPVEIIGFGTGVENECHLAEWDWKVEQKVFAQAYEMAKLDPYKDIDYMYMHDVYASWQFTSAEVAGYFRPGEGWRAVIEGRTAFDGDKPMSTTGGRTTMGHAWAASVGAELTEAVRQMRGLCGARQIKPIPEVSVVQGIGAGQCCSVAVLRRQS